MLDNRYFDHEEKEEVFGTCRQCGDEIGLGHEVVIFEDEIFCNDGCLLDFIKDNYDYTKRELMEDDI